MIEVIDPGPLATVQDLGRTGLAALGVGPSGAADTHGLRLANRLVGNPEGAAALELTLGGFTARFHGGAYVAAAGAPCRLRAGERAADMYSPIWIEPGTVLRVGQPARGLRTYLAVRGGIGVAEQLGSRATDLLAGLGPDPLAAGQTLPVGAVPAGALTPMVVDHAPQPPCPDRPALRIRPGPRDDWFTPDAVAVLCSAPYTVTKDSNRIGIRLRGPVLRRRISGELASEGLVTGAIQVPPDGQPVLFLADHPVTGGYPVIGVVDDADLPLAAQARPGQHLTFHASRPSR